MHWCLFVGDLYILHLSERQYVYTVDGLGYQWCFNYYRPVGHIISFKMGCITERRNYLLINVMGLNWPFKGSSQVHEISLVTSISSVRCTSFEKITRRLILGAVFHVQSKLCSFLYIPGNEKQTKL